MEKNLPILETAESSKRVAKLYDVSGESHYDSDFVIVVRAKKKADKVYSYYYDLDCALVHFQFIKDSFALNDLRAEQRKARKEQE